MKRTWVGVLGLLVAAGAGGCRKQAQAPPVTPLSGPLYTWPSDARTVPAGTLVVVRTFRAISSAGAANQRVFPVLIARDIPNSSGKPIIFGGSPASVSLLRNPAGGYRLGLHSVAAGSNTYLAVPEGANVQAGAAERGAPLGSLIDEVPTGDGTPETASPVTVEGPQISVPADMLLFFRLQQPLRFE